MYHLSCYQKKLEIKRGTEKEKSGRDRNRGRSNEGMSMRVSDEGEEGIQR